MPIRSLHQPAGMLLVALTLAASAFAQPTQDKTGLEINGKYTLNPFSKLSDPVAGTFEDGAKVMVSDFYADVAWHGLKFGEKSSFIPRFSYQALGLRYDEWTPLSVDPLVYKPTQLFGVKLHLTVKHSFKNNWSFKGTISPGIVSDYRNINSDHWKIDGFVLFSKVQDEKMTWGIGGVLDRRFGEMLVLPAVQLDYKVNAKASFKVMAPKYAEFWHQTWADAALGLGVWFNGEEYTRGKEVTGAEDIQPKGNTVRYSVGTIGPMCKYTLSNGWNATASLGLAFLRRYEVFNTETEVERKLDLKETVFFRMAVNVM